MRAVFVPLAAVGLAVMLGAVPLWAEPALAGARVLEATLAPRLDLDPDSPRYREPVGASSNANTSLPAYPKPP